MLLEIVARALVAAVVMGIWAALFAGWKYASEKDRERNSAAGALNNRARPGGPEVCSGGRDLSGYDDVRRYYATLPDEALVLAHREGAAEYKPAAWAAIVAEMELRGVEAPRSPPQLAD